MMPGKYDLYGDCDEICVFQRVGCPIWAFGGEEPTMTELQYQSVAKGDGGTDVRADRFTLWREQNAQAIADYNLMIKTIGVPLAEFRKF